MLTSLRIGAAAAFVMAGFVAGYTAPAHSSSLSNDAVVAYSPRTAASTGNGQSFAFPETDDEAEPILPRAYRSKCDDLDDTGQRLHCFRAEQDEEVKRQEGID